MEVVEKRTKRGSESGYSEPRLAHLWDSPVPSLDHGSALDGGQRLAAQGGPAPSLDGLQCLPGQGRDDEPQGPGKGRIRKPAEPAPPVAILHLV